MHLELRYFIKAIDILVLQLSDRFKIMLLLTDTFSILSPNNLLAFTEENLVGSASEFCKQFESVALVSEIIKFVLEILLKVT